MPKPSELLAISDLFQSKGWDSLQNDAPMYQEALESAIAMVDLLDEDQFKLLISLLYQYDTIFNYTPHVYKLNLLINDLYKQYSRIFISPLVIKINNRPKSGHRVSYDLQSYFNDREYPNLSFVDTPFSKRITPKDKSTALIMVDDYIGTGKSVENVYLEDPVHLENFTLIACCFYINEIGMQKLQELRIISRFNIRKGMAISDGLAIGDADVATALRLYEAIESNLDIKAGYKRGYGQTEALVTLLKTPDNTLPIFWSTRGKGGRRWPAIFPRPHT
jgi:hypothetical protein